MSFFLFFNLYSYSPFPKNINMMYLSCIFGCKVDSVMNTNLSWVEKLRVILWWKKERESQTNCLSLPVKNGSFPAPQRIIYHQEPRSSSGGRRAGLVRTGRGRELRARMDGSAARSARGPLTKRPAQSLGTGLTCSAGPLVLSCSFFWFLHFFPIFFFQIHSEFLLMFLFLFFKFIFWF